MMVGILQGLETDSCVRMGLLAARTSLLSPHPIDPSLTADAIHPEKSHSKLWLKPTCVWIEDWNTIKKTSTVVVHQAVHIGGIFVGFYYKQTQIWGHTISVCRLHMYCNSLILSSMVDFFKWMGLNLCHTDLIWSSGHLQKHENPTS